MITRLYIYLHPNTRGLPPKIWGGFMDGGVPCIFYGNYKSIVIDVKDRDYMNKTVPQKTAKGYKNVVHHENCQTNVNRASLKEELGLFAEYAGSINAVMLTESALNELLSRLLEDGAASLNENGTSVVNAVKSAMENSSNISANVVIPRPKKVTEAEKQTARELNKVLKVSEKAASKMNDSPAVDLSW